MASLAQTLRRYTSLNHLAQAARAVLQNSNQITQMLSDLNRVDFHNVQEQVRINFFLRPTKLEIPRYIKYLMLVIKEHE